jgi:hypothetical protein
MRDHLLKKCGLPDAVIIDQFQGTDIDGIFKKEMCFGKVRCDLGVGVEMCFDMGMKVSRRKMRSRRNKYSVGGF